MGDGSTLRTFADLIHEGVLGIGDGYRAKLDELGGSGPIFLRAGRLSERGFDWVGAERFHKALADKVAPKQGRVGDTVVTTKGNSVGRAGYVPVGAPSFVYSPHLSYWRSLDHNRLSPGFLRYWAHSPEFLAQLQAMAHSTDMAPYLSLVDQQRLRISIPDIGMQRAIAEVLGSLDDKIEADRNLARLAERLSIAQCMLTTEQAQVGSLASAERKQLQVENFTELVVDHFSLPAFDAGAKPERCAGSSVKSNKLLLEGPRVLVSRLNPHIPRIWHAVPKPEVIALASTEFTALRPKEGVSTEELWAVCSSPEFIAALRENVTGTTGSHQRVRPDDLLRATVQDPRGLPAVIRELLRSLVQLAASAREESVRLAELRDLLLPPLLSGELRVHELESLAGPV